jgi:hypothetical protein
MATKQTAAALRMRSILRGEFDRRRQANPRYSLRAFARSIGLDHSTVSQLIRAKRPISRKAVGSIGRALRWNGSAVLRTAGAPALGFDSRIIADRLGLTVDEVNIALTDLCLFHLIELRGEKN